MDGWELTSPPWNRSYRWIAVEGEEQHTEERTGQGRPEEGSFVGSLGEGTLVEGMRPLDILLVDNLYMQVATHQEKRNNSNQIQSILEKLKQTIAQRKKARKEKEDQIINQPTNQPWAGGTPTGGCWL